MIKLLLVVLAVKSMTVIISKGVIDAMISVILLLNAKLNNQFVGSVLVLIKQMNAV